MRHATGRGARLAGLDLARYLALAGMVFVNFKQAMHPALQEPGWLLSFFHFLEGKASATFVVLAGLAWCWPRARWSRPRRASGRCAARCSCWWPVA
ncbi:hypothetical protein [Delftia acidovorans]|uniref:hypothetical protein n=1 Tax=Delftia acidovorans TaxID=80866 RepID=UPI001E32B07D|nr:hypothetical protein [Delftia acidovorans]